MPINKDITALKLDDLSALRSNNYLAHYGVKGQKWGVRQWQDTSGKLTPAGRIHYGYGDGRKRKSKEVGIEAALGKKVSEIDDPHDKKGNNSALLVYALGVVGGTALAVIPSPFPLMRLRGGALALLSATMLAAGVHGIIKEKKAEKRVANAEKDEETGLPLKKEELTAEQDAKLTNPGYLNFNTNTDNNCALASAAFELRRRGFDVLAGKSGKGYTREEMATWFKGCSFETSEFMRPQIVDEPAPTKRHPDRTLPTVKRQTENLLAWITPKLESQPEGARGFFSVVWGDNDGFALGGHAMAYVIENGKPVIYDAQSGARHTNLEDILSSTIQVGYARIDNLECDYDAMRKAGVIP